MIFFAWKKMVGEARWNSLSATRVLSIVCTKYKCIMPNSDIVQTSYYTNKRDGYLTCTCRLVYSLPCSRSRGGADREPSWITISRLQHAFRVAKIIWYWTSSHSFTITLLEACAAVGVAVGLDESKHRGGVDVVVLVEEGAPRVSPHPDPDLPGLRGCDVLISD